MVSVVGPSRRDLRTLYSSQRIADVAQAILPECEHPVIGNGLRGILYQMPLIQYGAYVQVLRNLAVYLGPLGWKLQCDY
jgi:hypothetical protein